MTCPATQPRFPYWVTTKSGRWYHATRHIARTSALRTACGKVLNATAWVPDEERPMNYRRCPDCDYAVGLD